MADNSNSGNFANRAKEEVKNLARKGGQASHNNNGMGNNGMSNNGMSNMDAGKQRDNANNKGGKASSY
jgi:general stress protein YciG